MKVLQKCVNCGNKQEICVSYLSYKDEQNEMTCKECNCPLDRIFYLQHLVD